MKNHHMTTLNRDAIWRHNPGRMARCASPYSDYPPHPLPGEGQKKPVNGGTACGVSTLAGLRKLRVVRQAAGRVQVTIMVKVCDQGPMLLSFPMILQRKEYSFPDWKPGMSIFVQSPKLAL